MMGVDWPPIIGLTLIIGWMVYMFLRLFGGEWCNSCGKWVLWHKRGCAGVDWEYPSEKLLMAYRCPKCGAPNQRLRACEYCGSQV